MFYKKILVGHSEDEVETIIEHLEKSNIPFKLEIKDILKLSADEYEAFYMIKVQKRWAKQVNAIVAQYVSQKELKHWYKVEKKKSRKLERKENALYLFVAFIYFIAVATIEIGTGIFSAIGCGVLLLIGVFMMIKFFKEMKKESGVLRENYKLFMIYGVMMIFNAAISFISVFRLIN